METPKREPTPTAPVSSIPQKRALDEDHLPPVPSPLNPDVKVTKVQFPDEMAPATRDKPARTKKESLKKRESKGALGGATGGDSSRATPDPHPKEAAPGDLSPYRYKPPPPKPSDFEPPRGPIFTYHHEVGAPDGGTIEFCETSEQ
jgi:COMPASS component BRE2